MCFCSAEGIGYFFPALARFALLPTLWRDNGWYGGQLLFHLSYEGTKNKFLLCCSPAQRKAVAMLLHHLPESRSEAISNYIDEVALRSALSVWGVVD